MCFLFPQISYENFDSNFYEEHAEISALKNSDIEALRTKLGIKVSVWYIKTH